MLDHALCVKRKDSAPPSKIYDSPQVHFYHIFRIGVCQAAIALTFIEYDLNPGSWSIADTAFLRARMRTKQAIARSSIRHDLIRKPHISSAIPYPPATRHSAIIFQYSYRLLLFLRLFLSKSVLGMSLVIKETVHIGAKKVGSAVLTIARIRRDHRAVHHAESRRTLWFLGSDQQASRSVTARTARL